MEVGFMIRGVAISVRVGCIDCGASLDVAERSGALGWRASNRLRISRGCRLAFIFTWPADPFGGSDAINAIDVMRLMQWYRLLCIDRRGLARGSVEMALRGSACFYFYVACRSVWWERCDQCNRCDAMDAMISVALHWPARPGTRERWDGVEGVSSVDGAAWRER